MRFKDETPTGGTSRIRTGGRGISNLTVGFTRLIAMAVGAAVGWSIWQSGPDLWGTRDYVAIVAGVVAWFGADKLFLTPFFLSVFNTLGLLLYVIILLSPFLVVIGLYYGFTHFETDLSRIRH